MKRLKHLTLAHDEPAMGIILERFGAEGYGIYWLMLEHIGAGIGNDSEDASRTHSAVKWSQICHCSARRLRSFCESASELGLIELQTIAELSPFSSKTIEERLHIAVHKLLTDKEDALKKRKPAGIIPTVAVVKRDKIVDEIAVWFANDFWPVWVPSKNDSKAAALAAARKKATTEAIRGEMMAGMMRQRAARIASEPQFRVHAATWFNQRRWEDRTEPTLFAGPPQGNGSGGSSFTESVARDLRKRVLDGRL